MTPGNGELEPDPEAVPSYFVYGYVPQPATIYVSELASAPAAEAAQAARTLAKLASDVPAGREVIVELYLWQEGAARSPDSAKE